MARIQWKSRRTVGSVLGLLGIYLLLRVQFYEHSVVTFIPKIHPNEVWEFVADFSNMKFLNPTILDFKVIGESGNYDDWKYSVEYSENLSHWPYLSNYAVAHFNIKATPKKDAYLVLSTHKTCMFFKLYCLESESIFKFSHGKNAKGTLCEESVKYQCPSMLSAFCRREVVYQRSAIINNLRSKLTE